MIRQNSSCLEVLDRFRRLSCPVVSSMIVADRGAQSDGRATIVDCVSHILGMSKLA
jgi:hypothetical protein